MNLPAELNAAVVISQHMPAGFTRSFAERLNKLSALVIREAVSGDHVDAGTVLIAPGGNHLTIRRGRSALVAELIRHAPSDMYIPSADRMMTSVAETCGPAALGIVLTGMGNDGAAGAVAIHRHHGRCLAESQESAVILGMPQEAIKTGAVEKVLPLGRMAEEIVKRCTARSGGR
jgi:two-component system chemotaxis response regulator CheB